MRGNRAMTGYMNDMVKPFFLEGSNKEECILMIHGFTGSPADMRPLAAYLNRNGEGYPVCGILLPGHGTRMEDMMSINWKTWVVYATTELKRLLEQYPKVSVIGYSMGGDIALCLASKFKVERVITVSTPLIIKNKLSYIAEILSVFRKYTYWKNGKPLDGELVFDFESGYKGMPVLSIAQLRKVTIAAMNRLHRIKQPILIVQSLKDKVVHQRSPYIIFDHVKSEYKELILLENARHNAIVSPDRMKLYIAVEKFLTHKIPAKEPAAALESLQEETAETDTADMPRTTYAVETTDGTDTVTDPTK